MSMGHRVYIISPPQITDGCAGHTPGDTQFAFKLTVNTLNDDTQGFYRVSFSNVGGSEDVPASRVTGRGKIKVEAASSAYL